MKLDYPSPSVKVTNLQRARCLKAMAMRLARYMVPLWMGLTLGLTCSLLTSHFNRHMNNGKNLSETMCDTILTVSLDDRVGTKWGRHPRKTEFPRKASSSKQ